MNSRYIYQGLILTNNFYIVLLSLVTQYFSQKKHTLLYQLNIHRFAIMYVAIDITPERRNVFPIKCQSATIK